MNWNKLLLVLESLVGFLTPDHIGNLSVNFIQPHREIGSIDLIKVLNALLTNTISQVVLLDLNFETLSQENGRT